MRILWFNNCSEFYSDEFSRLGYDVIHSSSYPSNYRDVIKEIEEKFPNRIIYCHNAQYESTVEELVKVITVAQVAIQKHIHLTFITSENDMMTGPINRLVSQFKDLLFIKLKEEKEDFVEIILSLMEDAESGIWDLVDFTDYHKLEDYCKLHRLPSLKLLTVKELIEKDVV